MFYREMSIYFPVCVIPPILAILALPLAAQTPVVRAVVNQASGLEGPIAPGQRFSIQGTGLSTASVTGGNPLPSTLGGTTVLLDGATIKLVSVSPTVVTAFAPTGMLTDAPKTLVVRVNGTSSEEKSVPTAPSSPGLYTFLAGQVAMTDSRGGILTDTNPPLPCAIVSIYMTGGGYADPPRP